MECPNCEIEMDLICVSGKRHYECCKCGYRECADNRMYPNSKRRRGVDNE